MDKTKKRQIQPSELSKTPKQSTLFWGFVRRKTMRTTQMYARLRFVWGSQKNPLLPIAPTVVFRVASPSFAKLVAKTATLWPRCAISRAPPGSGRFRGSLPDSGGQKLVGAFWGTRLTPKRSQNRSRPPVDARKPPSKTPR